MASKYKKVDAKGNVIEEGVEPVIREIEIEGYWFKTTSDANGISFIKKGDKHREKPTITVSWLDILEIGADKQKERGELGDAQTAWDFLKVG
jgi:hypothetical protein